jgi:hypothetical protein
VVERHTRKNDINNGAIEVPKHKHHVALNQNIDKMRHNMQSI